MLENDKLSFVVTWVDDVSGLERRFVLVYWTRERAVEMVESKSKKIFLRKIKTEEIEEKDLFIGNTVTLLSRQLVVVDYGDGETKDKVRTVQESTFALIKPSSMGDMGKLLSEIYENGLTISRAKQTVLTGSLGEELYREFSGTDEFPDLVSSVTGAPALALVLVGENAVSKWITGLGSTDPEIDRQTNNNTIRARFGVSSIDNVAYASASVSEAERDIDLFFPSTPHANPFHRLPSSALLTRTTCCVILPHIVKERKVGHLVEAILESGFRITALESFHLDFGKAEEFLEIYKNVVANYGDMIKQLSSGMCFALELVTDEVGVNGNPVSPVEAFRELAGPRNPEIARKLRPSTLRARFGTSLTENAVHCTDLPEDGPLEVEYFFKVLQ